MQHRTSWPQNRCQPRKLLLIGLLKRLSMLRVLPSGATQHTACCARFGTFLLLHRRAHIIASAKSPARRAHKAPGKTNGIADPRCSTPKVATGLVVGVLLRPLRRISARHRGSVQAALGQASDAGHDAEKGLLEAPAIPLSSSTDEQGVAPTGNALIGGAASPVSPAHHQQLQQLPSQHTSPRQRYDHRRLASNVAGGLLTEQSSGEEVLTVHMTRKQRTTGANADPADAKLSSPLQVSHHHQPSQIEPRYECLIK